MYNVPGASAVYSVFARGWCTYLIQLFHYIHIHYSSVAQLSTSLCPKIHFILLKAESGMSLEIILGSNMVFHALTFARSRGRC